MDYEATLNKREQDCVRQLAEWFEKDPHAYHWDKELVAALGIEKKECDVLLSAMEHFGAVDVTHTSGGASFRISNQALQIDRQVKREVNKPTDKVAQVIGWSRQTWLVAIGIIVIGVAAALVTIVNGVLSIAEKFGYFQKP